MRSAVLVANGRRIRMKRRGGRFMKPVRLRGRTGRAVRVRIVARTRSGRKLTFSRRYRPCPARCLVQRRVTVRVKRARGVRLRSAHVVYAARRVRMRRRGDRLVATVRLRAVRGRRVRARIVARTVDGRVVRITRRLRPCGTKGGRS